MFCVVNQYITEKYPIKWKRIQYSVFSIQFFFALVTILCIDSILYIIIYNNI